MLQHTVLAKKAKQLQTCRTTLSVTPAKLVIQMQLPLSLSLSTQSCPPDLLGGDNIPGGFYALQLQELDPDSDTDAAQKPPKSAHPPVSANVIAARLIQIAKAPCKKFERPIHTQWRSLLQQATDKSLPNAFTLEEISAAMQKAKPATAPSYDQIHIQWWTV